MKKLIILISTLLAMSTQSSYALNLDKEVLSEGLEVTISDSDRKSLEVWIQDSYATLNEVLADVEELSYDLAYEKLTFTFKNVVLAEAPKKSQLLFRFALNRGLYLAELFKKESDKRSVGLIDQQVRYLRTAAAIALKYYEIDIARIKKDKESLKDFSFSKFGIEFSDHLFIVAKSTLDASAAYQVTSKILQFLMVDLNRDLNRATFARDIKKLDNEFLRLKNKTLTSDRDLLAELRILKTTYRKLSFNRDGSSKRIVEGVLEKPRNVYKGDKDYAGNVSAADTSYNQKIFTACNTATSSDHFNSCIKKSQQYGFDEVVIGACDYAASSAYISSCLSDAYGVMTSRELTKEELDTTIRACGYATNDSEMSDCMEAFADYDLPVPAISACDNAVGTKYQEDCLIGAGKALAKGHISQTKIIDVINTCDYTSPQEKMRSCMSAFSTAPLPISIISECGEATNNADNATCIKTVATYSGYSEEYLVGVLNACDYAVSSKYMKSCIETAFNLRLPVDAIASCDQSVSESKMVSCMHLFK